MALTKITSNMASLDTLTANNGVLELDDNGTHNGIINVPASLSINIDSDNGATTESFTISKDKTAINDTDVLFRIAESGNAVFGNSSTTNGDVTISNAGAEQLEIYAGNASDVNTFQHYNRSNSNYVDAKHIANTHIFQSGGSEIFRTSGASVLVGNTSNNTNAKVNIGASNGIPLTIGSDQYGGSGTTTFFTESVEGKTASNTHTITIAFTSQGSRWATHAVELIFAGSRDNATTPYVNKALYGFTSLTSIANITEGEDTGINTSCTAASSGMNFTMTVSANSVATYQVLVKVTSSFGNARPTSITCS